MSVAYRVLTEGVTLEVRKIKESRAGGARASKGRSQPDLLAHRATLDRTSPWF